MKKTILSVCQLSVVVFTIQVAVAQTDEACNQIEDAQERLECFDKQFPQTERNATPEPDSQRRTPVQETRKQEVEVERKENPQQEDPQQKTPPPSQSSDSGALFSRKNRLDMDSEIAEIRRGEQQRTIFRLTNNQIWMQQNPRDLPFRVGDSVNIKSGKVGGFMMRSEQGTSTRVRRIYSAP